jgi:hypothetical protein
MNDQDGQVDTNDANDGFDIANLENVDASGNLYGFLDDLDIALGENGQRLANGENVGIGSSAQLAIYGNSRANILIGGFDNDYIEGAGGNDLIFGGRLDYNNNPNLVGIVNDGMDVLVGGAGNDHIVFEADGGVIAGGEIGDLARSQDPDFAENFVDDSGNDTLWLTELAFGTKTAGEMISDGTVRIDLLAQNIDDAAGYGGADVNGTQDQSNYVSAGRVTVTFMDNVIATGLGAIDYLAAGTNNPELLFRNQQNIGGIDADLDLRGNDNNNILYANTGDDVIEGREGNDLLSGGEGSDDFIFAIGSVTNAGSLDINRDGVDVIHRQIDANADGIWDGTYGQDFGLDSTTTASDSTFTLGLPSTLAKYVDGIKFELDGTEYTVDGLVASDFATWLAHLGTELGKVAGLESVTVSSPSEGVAVLTDSAGREFVELTDGWLLAGGSLPSDGLDAWYQDVGAPEVARSQDRLLYVAYEDRNDGELRDDDSVVGSNVSLGREGYAQDLVISFSADGTRIAEDQAYDLTFTNLTTEDVVTITVNGVTYTLQVGVDLDGNSIGAEDGPFDQQPAIQAAFLNRLAAYINSFMDDDTAAGALTAALNGNTITITQTAYVGEETVFMSTPTVAIQQLSGGQQASVTVANVSQHEVHLLDFDGRDGALNAENVLFIGDTGISRATLQTAVNTGDTIVGNDAVLIDNAANTHAATVSNTGQVIFDSQATNAWLDNLTQIYSVHGDDLLIGGNGVDVINGGTGDDRVLGSLGNDTLDGGKNYYQVRVLGEAQQRVYLLNAWEAANFTLPGSVVSSISLVPQSETGVTLANGVFSDTLLFQQADFQAGATEFTITLNDYTMSGSVVQLRNDGAGTVGVDVNGDGVFESTTKFTNFENIRTVSGVGRAVAGDGQGNDTLNVSAMSTDAGGISYNLTNGSGAGDVKYSRDAFIDPLNPADRPYAADYESLVIRVDGVENVIGGLGNDLLLIDETEAAKNNLFDAGLGIDRVVYLNDFGGATPGTAEPNLTIRVNAAADTDEVVMTGGRLGTVVATDTLKSVEYIRLDGNTADSNRAADVLDVTAMSSGAVVDYTNGQIRDLSGNVQLVVEQIERLETVWGDGGNDTVIVGDNGVTMIQNPQLDSGNAPSTTMDVDLPFLTFMDFDELNATTNKRVPFASQTSAQIQNVDNLGMFTFDLSHNGAGTDVDTVDYSRTLDSISTVVMKGAQQWVLVDGDTDPTDNFSPSDIDRVDHLIGVERIVASQAESVLDFTSLGQDVQISFQFNEANANAATDTMENTVRIGDASGNTISGIPNYVERFDLGKLPALGVTAAWTRIEGGDFGESVRYDGSEDLTNLAGVDHRYTDDVLNLRGGVNNVSYYALETSVRAVVDVTSFNAADALNTGRIEVDIEFQDGTLVGTTLAGSGNHTITSYTSDNGIAAGSLKLEASQDAEDSVAFSGLDEKVYFLGTSAGVIDVKVGELDTMRLTGFEFLVDGASDDVYDMRSLANVDGNLTLTDNPTNDRDTIKVYNDAVGYGAAPADTISLEVLNDEFGFDFDVLDVTGVTKNNLILVGDTNVARDILADDVVVGSLDQIASINLFEDIYLTDASIASASNKVTLNRTAGQLQSDGVAIATDALGLDASLLSAGVELSIVGGVTGTNTYQLVGSAFDDTLTGGGGDDNLVGGAGADTLDGGTAAEVRQIELFGTLVADASGAAVSVNFNGVAYSVTVTEGAEIAEGAGRIAVGNALAAAVNADLVGINAGAGWTNGALTGASFDSGTGLLSFTFSKGADVLDGEVITVTGGEGTFLASGETIASQGGSGGIDYFIYESASDSTAAAMDTINGFIVGSDVIDLSLIDADAGTAGDQAFAGLVTSNAVQTNFGTLSAAVSFAGNDIYVGNTATDSYVFVDANQSGSYDANDLVIQLAGITDATTVTLADFAL